MTPSFAGGSIHQRKKRAGTRLSSYNSQRQDVGLVSRLNRYGVINQALPANVTTKGLLRPAGLMVIQKPGIPWLTNKACM